MLKFLFSIQEQETRTAILRTRARERQGITSNNQDGSSTKQITSNTETHYEIVIRNGACVSVPVTEERNVVQFTASGHVNFFANLEEGKQVEGVANKEHELEKKKEQEDYEKQIGLLTYLGQGSKESTGESAWYEKPSLLKTLQNQSQEEVNQKAERAKDMFDPLRVIRHYIGKPETTKKEQTKFSTDLRFPAVASVPLKLISGTETKDKKRKRKSEREHTKSKKRKKEKSKRRSSDDSDSSKKKKKKRSSKKRPSSSEEEKDLESESDDSDTEKKRQLAILRAKRIEREKAERVKKKALLAVSKILQTAYQKSLV